MEQRKAMPKVAHYTGIPGEPFGEEAPGVTIRVLIGEEPDGAPVYVLRMIEIEPGGNTPEHSHPYEHENFIVSGEGDLLLGEERVPVKTGDVAFVPPDVRHQYRNRGERPLVFLCGIPASHLRG